MNPPTDIHAWLEGIGLGELAPVFEENHITPDVLSALTGDDLREMGITSLGQRKKLLTVIAGFNAVKAPQALVPEFLPASIVPTPQLVTLKPAPSVRKIASVQVAPEPDLQPVVEVLPPSPPVGPKSKRKAFSAGFLTASICLHLLLAVGAGYWVVQRIEAKRKLQFAAGPPTASPSKRALEHKVSLQKKKNAGGSPAQARRISVTGLAAKITLPEMPSVPTTSTQFVAGRMAGMGGAGFGTGLGFGNGSGMGVGGGAGGAGLTMFGARGGTGLIGYFYDLKQTRDGKPTALAPQGNVSEAQPMSTQYMDVLRNFAANWDTRQLDGYYRSSNALVASQLYITNGSSDEAAKAFGEEKKASGYRWIVHYKGSAIASKDGSFRFIGRGDNIMLVRLNGKNVLDGGFPAQYQFDPGVNTDNNLGPAGPPGWTLSGGAWFDVKRGDLLKLEVLIGDAGGFFCDYLLIEERGVKYANRRDGQGLAYPVFQLASTRVPKRGKDGGDPETANQNVIFPGAGSRNALDVLRR
ncbi:MAG: hypothetical protein V4689_03310 [Verrucomicrobiota bacterium]